MTTWIPAGRNFIPADVIRWTEPVWKPRRSKKAKPLKIGLRQITAEVLKDEDGWVQLLVLENTVTENNSIKSIPPLKKGAELKRKRATLERGKPERLLWSDESARAALAPSA
jgi:hypothetical protein